MKQMVYFSGNYEIQTILFLVRIIFIIMPTACHFESILGLKFLFSEITNNYEQNYS